MLNQINKLKVNNIKFTILYLIIETLKKAFLQEINNNKQKLKMLYGLTNKVVKLTTGLWKINSKPFINLDGMSNDNVDEHGKIDIKENII